MGETREHLKKILELSEKITALGRFIRDAEKDMESTWADEIEKRDLHNLKEGMKEVEEALCTLQEEVGHIEAKHCKTG